MSEYRFDQLVDLDRVRSLLQAHHKITGVCSAILDLEQNILVAEGWEDICTCFHRLHPVTCARCLESNEAITHRLHEAEGGCRESKCKNGLWDIAMPIIIDGRMVATFFIGQFFYDDDEVDEAFFRAQAAEFGFDEEAYIAALRKVPFFTREQIRNLLDFYRNMVQVLAECGLKTLKLAREVEEREKAEKAQEAAKDYLEKIINSISDPIFLKDRQHRLVLVNDAECALAGRSREEMLGRTDYDFFPKEQVDVFWKKDELVFATGRENINEEKITDAQGEERVIVTKKSLYKDPNGKEHIVGIIRDITDRKIAEEQLALLNFAINRVQEAAYLIDGDGRFLYVNDEAGRSLGYSREELLDLTLPDIDPGYPKEQFLDVWCKLQECGSLTFEVSHKKKDGQIFPAEVNANYFEYGGNGYILALARDITERKRAESINLGRLRLLQFAATRTLEELLQATLDEVEALTGSVIGFYHFLEADQKSLSLQGWSTRTVAEFCTAAGKGMKYDVDQAGVWVDCVRQRRPVVHNDYASLPHRKGMPAGHPPVLRELVVPVMRSDRIVAILGVGNKPENYTDQDVETVSIFADLAWEIAERKQTEVKLALVDYALNHVHEAAFLVDEHARLHYVNREACRSLGYSCDELIDLTVADVDPDVSLSQWPAHWSELKAHGSLTFEGRHLKKNGDCFPVEINANYFEYEGLGYNLGLVRDITDRKCMEVALKESEARYRHSSNLLASILESASCVSVYALDREYRYLSFNRRHREKAKRKWGADIAVGMSILDAINTEEHREFCRQGFDRVLVGSSHSVESREVVVRDGRQAFEYNDNYGSPIFNDDGEVVGLTVFAIDITERKQMEEQLRESEQRYRDVFENVSDALYLLEVTEDGRFRNLEVNPALERSSGLSREEMLGKYVDETLPGKVGRAVVAKYRRCLEAGSVIDEELELDLPAGRRYFHSTLIPLRDDTGRIHRIAGITRDITDRKRAEELLLKQVELETRLAKLAEASPGAVMTFQLQPDGTARIPYASPRTEELTGFRPEKLARDVSIMQAGIHPDDLEGHLESIAESARTLRPWQNEFRLRHSTKGWIWIEGRSAPERQADGSIIWFGFLHDITARKRRQAREEIRLRIFERLAQGGELAEILRLVVEYVELANPDFIGNIMLVDAEGKYLHPVCSLGLPEEYLAAVKKVRIGEGVGSCGAAAWCGETIITSDLRTHPFWTKDKEPALHAGLLSCWSEPIFGASGTVLGTISIYRRKPGGPSGKELDLVRRACHLAAVAIERKRSQELLHESEQVFRTLVENSPNIILRYDRDCRRVYVNPAFEKQSGIPSGEALHRSPDYQWRGSIPPEEYTAKLRRVMETGEPAEILIEWPRVDDGRLTSHAFQVVAERDLYGQVIGALVIGHNITALKEAELRLAKLAASLPGFLYTYRWRPDGSASVPYASPGIQDIFGFTPDAVAEDATEFFSRILPEDLGSVRASIAESGHSLTAWHDEFRVRHPEKGELWVEGRALPKAQTDGGMLWYGFLHDITEHKNLEQELFQARKLEIIGQLAGGVAHEVRNPLNALLSISEALFREKDIAENPEYEPYIQHIRTQVGRLSKLMTDLLDLGKPIKAENIQPVSLYEVLTDTISLWTATDPTRNDRLSFTCDQQTRDLLVTVDPARLQQALLNLLDNALQHSTGNDPVCLHVGVPEERRISIWIRDAGKGIPTAKLEKAFEPFYTTRTGGTGLGLPLVKHIVESMGGEVKLFNNEPPPGCTAELKLRIERRREERA